MMNAHSANMLFAGAVGMSAIGSLNQYLVMVGSSMSIIAFSLYIYSEVTKNRNYRKWAEGGFKPEEKDKYQQS
jgi:uncharacterized membrane protein YiaA